MSQLDSLVHLTYQHLFDIDPEILDKGRRYITEMKRRLPARVLDDTTVDMIEIPELFRAINHTKTITGAATLFRSLVQPLDSLELIQAKQNSLRELEENKELTYKLNEYVNSLVEKEGYVYRYFFEGAETYNQYQLYRGTSVFFKRLVDGIKNVPKPETEYLKTLVEDIESIDRTYTLELIKGPVFSTWKGLKPGSEVGFFTPKIKFTLRAIKPVLIAPFAAAILVIFVMPSIMPSDLWLMMKIMSVFPIAMLGGMLVFFLPREIDYHLFTIPLRDIYVVDSNIRKGIEAIGKIDELLSFHEYSRAMNGEVIIPVVTENSSHYFVARRIKNPILAKNSYCVPNDAELNGQKLTFITGPNSGGKTTYCKTIAQIQVLAQIGCYVPAEEAEISIADRIFYQAPTFDSLRDAQGRFGAELGRTRDIFFNSTPKTLVVLDELAEATTYEEKLKKSYGILDGFHTIGNNTILVTHNHELVSRFKQEGRGQYLQVELKERMPTYKLIPGISKESHADLVSEKIGFSDKEIKEHLEKMNYRK